MVGLDQPLRVGDPRLGGEVEAVDRVAAVGRQRHALAGLEVGGARLGVLAGEPAELHHRHGGGVGQDDGHLEQHPELVADVVGGGALEGLGAVAALEQERLAVGDVGELGLQLVALAGEDQRRQRAQPGDGGVDGGRSGYAGCWDGPRACSVSRSGTARSRVGVRSSHPARVRRTPSPVRVGDVIRTAVAECRRRRGAVAADMSISSRRVVAAAFGGPESLAVEEVDPPRSGAGRGAALGAGRRRQPGRR